MFRIRPTSKNVIALKTITNEITANKRYKVIEIFNLQLLIENDNKQYKYYDSILFK